MIRCTKRLKSEEKSTNCKIRAACRRYFRNPSKRYGACVRLGTIQNIFPPKGAEAIKGGVSMFSYVWPIVLVVLSNIVYQICAKSVPGDMNPLASLTVTYLIGAAASAILYAVLNRGGSLIREYSRMNWAPLVLGIVIVGLEVGWIYAYKAGWQVSTGFIVQSAFLAVALVFVGYLLYKEALTWNKLVGIGACLAGLVFINLK